MIIKELKLRNFRNISSCTLKFKEGITVLLGQNAQGKTNILESLVFLSTTRSHRLLYDQQMIQDDKELCNLECTILDEKEKKIGAVIYQKGKTLLINSQPVSKSSDFIGKLNVVLFSPSDLEIFDDSPKERRRVMDIEIGKCSSQYMFHLSKYLKLLKERNTCLKMNRVDESYLVVLENQMIECQIQILIERKKFFELCNQTISKFYNFLSKQNSLIEMVYESCIEITSLDQMKKDLRELYNKNKEKDLLYKMTSIGIHRDDFYFIMNGKKVEMFCSQGQKRMVILALKFSLVEYIKRIENKIPVLLLDDVLSELDSQKRINLFKLLDNYCQTIITTTELVEGFDELKSMPFIYVVENGQMQAKEGNND
ncbi:DNA replication/repair protein RecF [Anaerorhabdus furcosa]|uniref:DNA replication and repair protein RecF n=1 Tax=Anaerorhabdus furcosa TaxID=118967 RepID=A0A1T4KSY3_9FIRM|nr:DNA replication/repair protein RecF [Anaerorhabdus furcosa]SJZ45448.1 DNA replication and repair protein RecF [Anaerorhabdus furcosa]